MQRDKASTAIMIFTGLFIIGFVVQLFLASLGMMGAESYDAHEAFGGSVMHLLSLLVFIAAVAGPNRKSDWLPGLGFFVLVTVVIILAGERDDHPWVAAFHPITALAATGMAFWLHMRVRTRGAAVQRPAAA